MGVQFSYPALINKVAMEEKKNITEDIVNSMNWCFKNENLIPKWDNYSAVSKFKSVKRAIKRGHVNLYLGNIYPDRPFNNRKPTPGRALNERKKKLYEHFRLQ